MAILMIWLFSHFWHQENMRTVITTKMMMKPRCSLSLMLLLMAIINSITAFTVIVPTRTSCRHVGVPTLRSKAEDHLQEMSQKWEALKAKEESMLQDAAGAGGDPSKNTAAMELALEMVETAIEHVHAKEEVEEEHVMSVHGALERVLKKEQAIESMEQLAIHDAQDADSILQTYQALDAGEDVEKRRELAVADLAHHVEDYAEERLHQLQEEEEHIREEEDEIKQEIKQWKWNEDTLNEVLNTLKSLKQEAENIEKQ